MMKNFVRILWCCSLSITLVPVVTCAVMPPPPSVVGSERSDVTCAGGIPPLTAIFIDALRSGDVEVCVRCLVNDALPLDAVTYFQDIIRWFWEVDRAHALDLKQTLRGVLRRALVEAALRQNMALCKELLLLGVDGRDVCDHIIMYATDCNDLQRRAAQRFIMSAIIETFVEHLLVASDSSARVVQMMLRQLRESDCSAVQDCLIKVYGEGSRSLRQQFCDLIAVLLRDR